MKIYYFSQVKPEDKGVFLKKKYQEKAFLENEVDLKKTITKKLTGVEYEFYFEKIKLGKENFKRGIINTLKRRIFQRNIIYKNVIKNCVKNEIDYIYLRYYRADYFFLKFLKKIKSNGIGIVIEIPTYPYDEEVKKNNFSLMIDKYYRKKLYKYVDKVITYSEDKKIWGINCINIFNGIDLKEIKLVTKKHKNKNGIVFTSVSNCSFWHGIDRFLNSLEKYSYSSSKEEVIFNIVGEGVELDKLKKMVSRSKYLSDIVKFQGFKIGRELDEIYNKTDIAIGCLGNHRKGIYTIQALKNKEYMAKGLPMIFSEDDPGLREKKFVYKATHDEQLIDISDLLKWYKNLKLKPEEIRDCAKEFTWNIQMKKVIDELESIQVKNKKYIG